MGERALAAARLPTDEFACYHSQWGARASTVRRIFALGCWPPGESLAQWEYQRCLPWSAVVETLDYLRFETVYRLFDSRIEVYLPLWLGFSPSDLPQRTNGVLVRTHSASDFFRLEKRVRRVKSTLGRAVENGELGPRLAQQQLLAELSGREWDVSEHIREALP